MSAPAPPPPPDAAPAQVQRGEQRASTRAPSEVRERSTSGSARGTRRQADWREIFRAGDSLRVLARLMQDDPLALRARVAARLAEQAYLIDIDRALLRSFARTARAASGYGGDPPLDRWLDERIDEALADLLTEDLEAERAGRELDERQAAVLTTLGRPLGLTPGELRAACVLFNRLPQGDRRAFHALVIRGRALDELARERGESASAAACAARRALDALLHGSNVRRPNHHPNEP